MKLVCEDSADENWRARLAFEQIVQFGCVATSIVERIFLAALFYRFWGAEYFEAWSVAIAIAGMVSLSQMGFASYYQNKIAILLENGQTKQTQKLVRESFTVLLALSVLGAITLCLFVIFGWESASAFEQQILFEMKAAAILLVFAFAARLPISNLEGLYRASREYSVYSSVLLVGDIAKCLLISFGVIIAEPNLLLAAISVTFAITVTQIFVILRDKSKRFPKYQLRLTTTKIRSLQTAAKYSAGFLLNTLTAVLLASLPVLMLHGLSAETGVISAFLVMRILFGLPRTISQATSVVIGHEIGRRVSKNQSLDAWRSITESSRTIAICSGLIVGALVCMGQEFTVFWMGDGELYRHDLVLFACLPALFMPAATIANNVLMTNNRPYLSALARLAQIVLFFGIWFLAPKTDPAAAMFMALSIAEIIGFSFLAKIFCFNMLAGRKIEFFFADTLWSISMAGVIYIAHYGLTVFTVSPLSFPLQFAWISLVSSMLLWFFSLDEALRKVLLKRVVMR